MVRDLLDSNKSNDSQTLVPSLGYDKNKIGLAGR